MKRLLVCLLFLLLLLPSNALADPAPLTPVPPGDDQIEPVKKGDPAPYSGQLFSPSTGLRWANFLQQCRFRLQADVDLQKKTDQADIDYQKRLVTIEQEKYNKVTTELEQKISLLHAQVTDPPFYRTVWFGVVLGVLATGAVVGLTAWGFSSVN